MSSEARGVDGADVLADRLGEPPVFRPPEGWTLSGSWKRAQVETDRGGPQGPATWTVWLEASDHPRTVLFALLGGELRAECPCQGFRYGDVCAHTLSLWWRWVRGRIMVRDLDTGREHPHPPAWFRRRGGRR